MPEGSTRHTITPPLRRGPLPSPFTSCFGFTRHRWPLLSWVVGPFRELHQLIPVARTLLSCTLQHVASNKLRGFRVLSNNQPEQLPKILLIPHRLCTLLHAQQATHEGSGPCQFAYTIAPKMDAMDCPQTGMPLQSFSTQTAIYTCHQVVDSSLMTLAIPAELSRTKLAPYWLDAPPLTFARR